MNPAAAVRDHKGLGGEWNQLEIIGRGNDRGILSWRGEVTQLLPGKLPRLVGNIGDREELGGYQKVATGTKSP